MLYGRARAGRLVNPCVSGQAQNGAAAVRAGAFVRHGCRVHDKQKRLSFIRDTQSSLDRRSGRFGSCTGCRQAASSSSNIASHAACPCC